MAHILVTGSRGQLGQCLQLKLSQTGATKVFWEDSESLDITQKESLASFFKNHELDYCINCAAYTAVDLAESKPDKAIAINTTAVEFLAKLCAKYRVVLIHISTDYVFDGLATSPYFEDQTTAPINVYGKSKRDAELAIKDYLDTHFIIRTSWLYSQFGKNFYKSIRSKLEAGEKLSIVTNQTGTPTNANDLASFIVLLITTQSKEFGLYNFSNSGEATWYDFATAIAQFLPGIDTNLVAPIDHYATFAKRPAYSVLAKNKILEVFGVEPVFWKDSLADLINPTL